jgi:hypothetical protein
MWGDSAELYIPKDDSIDIVLVDYTSDPNDTEITYSINPSYYTLGNNVGRSTEYYYNQNGEDIVSYPYKQNTYTYTAEYAKQYPQMVEKLKSVQESQSEEVDENGKSKTRFSYKFDTSYNVPSDAFSYSVITSTHKELTGTGYYAVNTCYMTEKEFADVVNNLTYYKAEMCDIGSDKLLKKGYSLTQSGEKFEQYVSNATDVQTVPENIYTSSETGLSFDTELLDTVTDSNNAVALFQSVVDGMSDGERQSVKAKDELAYLAEELSARASTVNTEDDIVINDGVVSTAVDNIASTKLQTDQIITASSVGVRNTRRKVRVATTKSGKVSVTKENITKSVDVVEAVTPFAALEFEPKSVSELSVENSGTNKLAVSFNKADSASKVTVKFPNITTDGYKAIVDDKGNTLVSKYNPITNELSAKISDSGVFTVVNNEKSFTDIKNSPIEVQNAIKALASKGIIKGTSETEFSPDSPITRAEIAALIVRILNVDDANADGGFSDVTKQNWYFGAAGSSKRENIIAGYEDNTFRGTVVIPKVQITSVIARTLKNRLGYNTAAESVLNEYSDSASIPQWSRSDVALATYANMVIKRTDNSFEPNMEMTRGDAALVLEKLYDKVW